MSEQLPTPTTESATSPATEPTGSATSAPAAKIEERPHPLTPLAKSWMAVAAIVFFFARDFIEHGRPNFERFGIVGGVIVGVVLIFGVVGGFASWLTTRFVIDDEELRIERRFIWHSSDKVRFDRIQSVDVEQPLLARFLSLAALRIDVGGIAEAKKIEFLSRKRAYEMRDYLLARAHGQRITVEQSAAKPVGDAFEEVAGDDQIIYRVTPKQLIATALTATNVWVTALLLFGPLLIAVRLINDMPLIAAFIPSVLSVVGLVWKRISDHWNFTLSRTGRGLRISQGLTSLNSQALPLDRVQAVSISQSVLWRPLKLYSVQINVLGFIPGGESEAPKSVLLPAGTIEDVRAALATLWPGFDADAVELTGIPRRVRWLHPIAWHTIKWGFDDFAMVTEAGVLTHQRFIVPLAKLQSLALDQGPLQRRFDVANVTFHLPLGAIGQVRASDLDENDARWLALTTPSRAQAARDAADDRTELDAMAPPLAQPPAAPLAQDHLGYPSAVDRP